MPAALIDHGPQRSLYRYLPVEQRARQRRGPPVLLVPPLAAPAFCFDLRRGCSLAEHLLLGGRETLHRRLRRDRVRATARSGSSTGSTRSIPRRSAPPPRTPAGGRCGWSAGRSAASSRCSRTPAEHDLPIDAVALIGSPFDFSRVPMIAPLRPIAAVTRGRGHHPALPRARRRARAAGPRGYQLLGIEKYLMKPWTIATNLDDRDLLAQIEAVDAFMSRMHAYPGRTFGQLFHRFFRTNDLAEGRLALTGRTVDLADVARAAARRRRARRRDRARRGLPPPRRARPERASLRLETAPGGHLGVLTGRARAARRGCCWTSFSSRVAPRRLGAGSR